MIPVPPSIWSVLPGRAAIASAYQTAGMTLPWLPISLDPSATWLGLLSILPASAVFLAMLSLEPRSRRVLVVILFIVAVANVLLDMVQTVGGYTSPWRFYADTNLFRPVGLFANSNHNAAFLYSAIPFAVAWAIGLIHDHRRNHAIGLTWLGLLVLLLIVGVSLTLSRAGMVLLFLAGLACLLLIWRHDRGQSGRRLLAVGAGASLVALLIAFQVGFVGLVQRMQGQGLEDMRWPVAEVTTKAAIANLPFGSGIGTFVPVYDEFAPRTLVSDTYVNHAHDDWLELFLTGGVPAMLLAGGFLVWLAASIFRLWRSSQPESRVKDLALARAASIVIVLLLLHSAMDYPLRIPTLSVLFAIACGFLVPWRKAESRPTLRA
jgi:O-antigen ligase